MYLETEPIKSKLSAGKSYKEAANVLLFTCILTDLQAKNNEKLAYLLKFMSSNCFNKLYSFFWAKCILPFLNVTDNPPNNFMAKSTSQDKMLSQAVREIDAFTSDLSSVMKELLFTWILKAILVQFHPIICPSLAIFLGFSL